TLYGGHKEDNPCCPHFLGIHELVGEKPYLTPWFFLYDMPTYAVLHALPIARTKDHRFVPCVTVFIITYFCEDPKLLLERHFAAQHEYGKDDRHFWPATVYPSFMAQR